MSRRICLGVAINNSVREIARSMLYKSLIKWEVCNTSAVPIAVRLGTVVVGLALGRNTSVGLSAIFLGQLNFLLHCSLNQIPVATKDQESGFCIQSSDLHRPSSVLGSWGVFPHSGLLLVSARIAGPLPQRRSKVPMASRRAASRP